MVQPRSTTLFEPRELRISNGRGTQISLMIMHQKRPSTTDSCPVTRPSPSGNTTLLTAPWVLARLHLFTMALIRVAWPTVLRPSLILHPSTLTVTITSRDAPSNPYFFFANFFLLFFNDQKSRQLKVTQVALLLERFRRIIAEISNQKLSYKFPSTRFASISTNSLTIAPRRIIRKKKIFFLVKSIVAFLFCFILNLGLFWFEIWSRVWKHELYKNSRFLYLLLFLTSRIYQFTIYRTILYVFSLIFF